MRLTKSKLQQIIKEELGRVLGEKKTKIEAEPIEGEIDEDSLVEKALEIIELVGEISYNELADWLYDNHETDEDPWLFDMIEAALDPAIYEPKQLLQKYYDGDRNLFQVRR